MDKIEKIRQKIKELRELLEDHNYYLDNSEQALGYGLALDDIGQFLDTLSEEPNKSLEEAAEEYGKAQYGRKASLLPDRCRGCYAPIVYAFKAGAEWAFMQGWTFNAHKGDFGICFDGSIDNLLDSLKDDEEVTIQIRKK